MSPEKLDKKLHLKKMRIFILHGARRITLDVDETQKVKDVKEIVREAFDIGSDEGPAGVEVQEKKILTLNHSGADLHDSWWFSDIGIIHGSTIKAIQREEVKPSFFIFSAFNGKTVPVLDKISFKTMKVDEFRALASRKIGLPVSVFRLLNSNNVEMYDYHSIDDYGIELGSTVTLETWDGWNEFLNLCILGFATQVMQHLSQNENEARFQMKVAMFIAAHFNHTDLAVSMSRNGIKADEAVGEHPSRMWCKDSIRHIDTLKTSVHEASESGSLGVLRSFIHNNLMNVLAKDGNNLTPLNIALRKKQKPCASFLLTKQWSKISYTKKHSIPLSIYVKIRRWADKAKDKTFTIHGQWKSSLKNPKRIVPSGCLVGMNVLLDGYSKSKLKSLSENEAKQEEEDDARKRQKVFEFEDDTPEMEPEVYFRSLNSIGAKMSKYSKYGKSLHKVGIQKVEKDKAAAAAAAAEMLKESDTDAEFDNDGTDTETGIQSPDLRRKNGKESELDMSQNRVRFPPLNKGFSSQSQYELTQYGHKEEPEFDNNNNNQTQRSVYLKTGTKAPSVRTARTMPTPTPGKFLPSISSRSNINPDSARTRNKETPRPKDSEEPSKPRKKARSIKSAVMVAKAKSEAHNIPLPVVSWDTNPRPFVHPRNREIAETLRSYDRMRGISSRDYAIQCLSVASGFKEKPWLAQVQQALSIASRGVKKTIARQPHLFLANNRMSATSRISNVKSEASASSRRTFMTA